MRSHNRPKTDVFRCISVGVILMAALTALEVQAFAVGCGDVATPGTSPAGVSGIDQFESNPFSSSLILDKELPSGIRPAVDLGSEVFALLERRVSDVAQVFTDDSLCSDGHSVADQLLTRLVEESIRYGCLVPGHPSQEPPGGFGANGLDGGAGAPDARTTVVKPTAFEEKCLRVAGVGGGHQAFHAKVHTNNAPLCFGFRDFDLMGENQIPLVSDPTDFGILPPGLGNTWTDQFDGFSEDGYALPVSGEVPAVGHGYGRFSVDCQFPTIVGLGSLVGGGNLAEQRTGKLRRELKLFTDGSVELIMQLPGVQLLGLEHDWGNPVQRVKIPEAQNGVMLHIPGKLDLDCTDCFQYKPTCSIFQNMSTTKNAQRGAIHPTAKAVGFLAQPS